MLNNGLVGLLKPYTEDGLWCIERVDTGELLGVRGWDARFGSERDCRGAIKAAEEQIQTIEELMILPMERLREILTTYIAW